MRNLLTSGVNRKKRNHERPSKSRSSIEPDNLFYRAEDEFDNKSGHQDYLFESQEENGDENESENSGDSDAKGRFLEEVIENPSNLISEEAKTEEPKKPKKPKAVNIVPKDSGQSLELAIEPDEEVEQEVEISTFDYHVEHELEQELVQDQLETAMDSADGIDMHHERINEAEGKGRGIS